MLTADLIREARSEREIYQLLNAYIEGAEERNDLAYSPLTLPRSTYDVMQRCSELVSELDAASRTLDDRACVALKEAVHVFSNALQRLKLLEREQQRPLAAYVAQHGNWRDVGMRDGR
jgi:hypothetical protein